MLCCRMAPAARYHSAHSAHSAHWIFRLKEGRVCPGILSLHQHPARKGSSILTVVNGHLSVDDYVSHALGEHIRMLVGRGVADRLFIIDDHVRIVALAQ